MIIEATLIGFLCYLGALSSPWLLGLTGGWYLITRPLVSGMLVGLILGDVKTGIMIGVAVQAVYIAMVTPGGSMPADLNFVAYPAIALGILSGKGPEVAVALAATIGIAGTILFNAMMVLNSSGTIGPMLRWIVATNAEFISTAPSGPRRRTSFYASYRLLSPSISVRSTSVVLWTVCPKSFCRR